MASSRTGTTRWKALRVKALTRAQNENITHCRYCHVFLDYSNGMRPNSAVPDHIIPYSAGGADALENLEVICRRCNTRLGSKHKSKTKKQSKQRTITPKTTIFW